MLRLALIDGAELTEEYDRAARRLPDIRFVAVTDRDSRTAEETARALGADVWTDRFDQLLKEHSAAFDAVVIHSPSSFHERQCRLAAEAGKHLLVATPLALSTNAGAAIVDACRDADIRLMLGRSLRFSPAVQSLKNSVDSGRLGESGLLRLHRWDSVELALHRPEESPPKRSDAILFDRITDDIDLACWILGEHPAHVYGAGRGSAPAAVKRLDYVQLHLGFASGAMALLDYAATLPKGDGYFSLSLIGSTGAAYADDHHNKQLLFGGGIPGALHTGQGASGTIEQLREFGAAIAEEREPLVTGADGLRSLQVAELAAESLATRQVVSARSTINY